MRIDTRQTLKEYDGSDVTETALGADNKPYKKPVTLRDVFVSALNTSQNSEVVTEEKKSQIYFLSLKLFATHEVSLTVNEMALIKEKVNKAYPSPLIYGRVCDIFDGDQPEETTPTPN